MQPAQGGPPSPGQGCDVPPPLPPPQHLPPTRLARVQEPQGVISVLSNGVRIDAGWLAQQLPGYRLTPDKIWDAPGLWWQDFNLSGGPPNFAFSKLSDARRTQMRSARRCFAELGHPETWRFHNQAKGFYPSLIYCPEHDGPSLCKGRVWIASIDPLVHSDSTWLAYIGATTLYDDIRACIAICFFTHIDEFLNELPLCSWLV